MEKEKCYHMTSHLKEIIQDGKLDIKVGKNSNFVNDIKSENKGISYSLGLEGLVATNAMFRARYQYDLLENQTDRYITLDDMFLQNVNEQENRAVGSNIYLIFDETEQIRNENIERDIADPKTKSVINIENISGVVLKNKKTGELKYDRDSILRYAISKINIEDMLSKLTNSDRPFMNMEGYGKTDFSFKEYLKRYCKEMLKESETIEISKNDYELEMMNVNELLNLVEKDNKRNFGKSALEDVIQDDKLRTSNVKQETKNIFKKLKKENNKEKIQKSNLNTDNTLENLSI